MAIAASSSRPAVLQAARFSDPPRAVPSAFAGRRGDVIGLAILESATPLKRSPGAVDISMVWQAESVRRQYGRTK
jgi:hypothetical protein